MQTSNDIRFIIVDPPNENGDYATIEFNPKFYNQYAYIKQIEYDVLSCGIKNFNNYK